MEDSCKPPITLRNARPEDATQVCDLGRTVFSTTFAQYTEEKQLQTYLETGYNISSVTSQIVDPNRDFVVATSNEEGGEEVIGFAVLTRGNTYPCLSHFPQAELIELSRIYVSTAFHGRGVGKALMGEVEGRAKGEGRKWIWLCCYESNERAKGVYRKAGYERVGERKVRLGEELGWGLDWVMVKGL